MATPPAGTLRNKIDCALDQKIPSSGYCALRGEPHSLPHLAAKVIPFPARSEHTTNPANMKSTITLTLMASLATAASAQLTTLPMQNGQTQNSGSADFSKVYVAGGMSPDFSYTTLIQVYDRVTGVWNEPPLFLTEGRGKVACAINGHLLVCGGGIIFETLIETKTVEIIDLEVDDVPQVDSLSVARVEMAVASVGSKVVFAGGMDQDDDGIVYTPTILDAVDIYDVVTDEWSTAVLSEARSGMASAALGSKAYFAGGYTGNGQVSDRVDIYDATSGLWTTATLSVARAFYGGGVAVGSKIMFAGGQLQDQSSTDVVDIYDTLSGLWSTANISEARYGIQAAATGDYAIFGGGGTGYLDDWYYGTSSSTVDIYNDGTGQWTEATMADERVNFLTAASGNQVFLMGGYNLATGETPPTMDVFTDLSTIGMEDYTTPAALNAWPNPFTDKLNLGALDALAGCTVEVYDAQGAHVSSTRLKNTLSVDLASLTDGLYHVRVLSSDGRRTLMSGPVVKGH